MRVVNENEIWKTIPIEPDYEASNLGRIRSVDKIVYRKYKTGLMPTQYKGRIRKQTFCKTTGYFRLCLDGRKSYTIHRLVCMAFNFESFFNGAQVNHKDGNKINNNADNLEWVTPKQNIHHATKTGLFKNVGKHMVDIGDNHPSAKISFDIAREIREMHKSGIPAKTIMKKFDIKKSTFYNVLSNKIWKDIDACCK